MHRTYLKISVVLVLLLSGSAISAEVAGSKGGLIRMDSPSQGQPQINTALVMLYGGQMTERPSNEVFYSGEKFRLKITSPINGLIQVAMQSPNSQVERFESLPPVRAIAGQATFFPAPPYHIELDQVRGMETFTISVIPDAPVQSYGTAYNPAPSAPTAYSPPVQQPYYQQQPPFPSAPQPAVSAYPTPAPEVQQPQVWGQNSSGSGMYGDVQGKHMPGAKDINRKRRDDFYANGGVPAGGVAPNAQPLMVQVLINHQ